MSKSGLVLDVGETEQPRGFLEEVTLLVGVLRAAHEANGVRAVDGHFSLAALRGELGRVLASLITAGGRTPNELRHIHLLGGNPGLVARLADLLRDPRDRVVPGNLLPVVAAGRPIAGRREPLRGGVRRE